MNTQDVVETLIDVAQKAMPLLPFGPVGMIVARAAVDAMQSARETLALSEEQIVALDDERIALERAVNERAKEVAAKLLG